jgi:flagellar biosynthesis protein FlhB
MHRQIYQKFIFQLSLFGIAISILVGLYDVIFGYLWEFIHIILEVIELSLDRLIEHIFETDLHETQLVVFYIMLVIGGVLIFLVWKVLVYLFRNVSQNLKNEWAELRAAITTDWQKMSMTNRVICITVFLVANYLASFLLF